MRRNLRRQLKGAGDLGVRSSLAGKVGVGHAGISGDDIDAPEFSALSIDFMEQGCRKIRRARDAPEQCQRLGAGNSGRVSMRRGSWRRFTAENLGDRRPCAGVVAARSLPRIPAEC